MKKKPTHYRLPRRRRPAASRGIAPDKEKLLPESLSLLWRSNYREAKMPGVGEIKNIVIRFSDVEKAVLVEVQKRNQVFKDLRKLVIQ